MAITLEFQQLNISIQPGDAVYRARTMGGQSGSNNPYAGGVNTKPQLVGYVTNVVHADNQVVVDNSSTGLTVGSEYVFFSKNKAANFSGITGYYIEAEYRNYSTLPVEIFATAVDYVESSK